MSGMSSRRFVRFGSSMRAVKRAAKSCFSVLGIAIRRRDQPEVRAPRDALAEPLVLAVGVEHAQEVRLQLDRELADLVEEQAPAVGLADEAAPLRHAGVRVVLRVAEELGVDEPATAASRRCARRTAGGRAPRDGAPRAPRAPCRCRSRRGGASACRPSPRTRASRGASTRRAPRRRSRSSPPRRTSPTSRLGEEPKRRDLLGPAHAVENELATQMNDVARPHEGGVRRTRRSPRGCTGRGARCRRRPRADG